MTEQEVKDRVRAVLVVMVRNFQFMAWDTHGWTAYTSKPRSDEWEDEWSCEGGYTSIPASFYLPPFPGDWRDSLVEREE